MKKLFYLFFVMLFPSVLFAAPITGSPMLDSTKTNPFITTGEGSLQGSNGTALPGLNQDANATLTSAGFTDAASFATIIGTSTTTGILGDVNVAGGLSAADLTAAQAGNTNVLKDTIAQANLSSSLLAAGITSTIIKLRYNVSYAEKIGSMSLSPPVIINTPIKLGRMAPEVINAGVPPAKVTANFSTGTIKNITTLLSTTLNPIRLYPLTVAPGNGLKVEWPCNIDIATGVDSCCGITAGNAIFHVQKGVGLADDLDIVGAGDAVILDQTGIPVTLSSDLDALARLVVCSSTTSMDVVVAGSSRFVAQGIPVK